MRMPGLGGKSGGIALNSICIHMYDKKTKKTVGLQMRMLGLLGEKAGGGVREEGAAPLPQSSMSIAILTCIAIIECVCVCA